MQATQNPLILNESIYFDYTPPPTFSGHYNRHPFKIHITSSNDGPHVVILDAKYSRSYNPQPSNSKWSFLRPEYRFLDLSGNKIDHVITNDTSFYLDNNGNLNNVSGTFIGVSGFAEFYFIDDIYNFDLAINNQPYTTIIATLQTSAIEYFYGAKRYITPSYSNSLATAYQPHIFYYRNPDYIKISENGVRDFVNPRWSTATQPVVFTLNWNGNYVYNDVTITPYNGAYNFCHYFPTSISQQIQISANVVGINAHFNKNLSITYTNNDGYLSQGYCKSSFNVSNQTSLGCYITAAVNFDSHIDFVGNYYSPKIWISNPQAGSVVIAEYTNPNNFSITDLNFSKTQFKNIDVPIILDPDYSKDNLATIGYHGINSIAILPPPDFKAWACDGELNYLYKFSTEGNIISAIDINQIVTKQNLGFFVQNQVSPASITLDSNLNIWMTLYDTVSVLKLDRNGNFLFALNPLSSINYTVPPNINYNWYLDNEMNSLSEEVQNFVEPTYIETDQYNNVWVTYSNYASGYLIKYDANGNLLKAISYPPQSCPQDVIVDNKNNVWVALSNNTNNTIGSLEKRNSSGMLLSSYGNITGLNNITLDLNQNIWFTYSYSRIGTINNLTGNITTINISDYSTTPLPTPRNNPSEIVFSSSPQSKTVDNSINNINSIILSLDNTPSSKPNGNISDSSYGIAYQQILNAKAQIQQEVVDYAITNYPAAMNNNPTLTAYCYRDTGYIIDAIAADILNNANHRSIEVGNFYYKGVTKNVKVPYGELILPLEEVAPTINSINQIAAYIINNNIVTNTSRQADVVARLANVVYPLQNNGALNSYSPAGNSTTTDINMANIISSNRSQLQSQVSQYVVQKGYLTNSSLLQICRRDIGLIVDAICADLVSGTDARSIEYGLAYWNGSTTRLPDSLVPNHKTKTIDTFNYLNTCIKGILAANGNITQSTISQYNIYPDAGLTVPDEYTSETALEGIAADAKGNVYIINSVENEIYIINSLTKTFIDKFYINPKGFNFYNKDNKTVIDYNPVTKSAQAYGDWTGFRWINKYYYQQNPRIISLSGKSINLDFYADYAFDVFKKNENFDQAGQMKSLGFMPVLQDNPVFFDNFLGSIFGKYPFNHNDLGIESYEKIANFVPNNTDVDVCGIDQLYNLADSINQNNNDYRLNYPEEIKRLINLASINQSLLWGTTSKNQNYFKEPSPDGVFNRGHLLTSNYTVSAGTPVILNTRSLHSYDLIPTGPINGLSSYPLSTLASYIGLDPINWTQHYNFYQFIPGYSQIQTEGIIDWSNPQTTISQTQSSLFNWAGDQQTLDKLFSYNLYNGLGLLDVD